MNLPFYLYNNKKKKKKKKKDDRIILVDFGYTRRVSWILQKEELGRKPDAWLRRWKNTTEPNSKKKKKK